jgi:orotate phosphoribosyltransferase
MVFDTRLARELANDLLRIKAIKLQPNEAFIWTSGMKSPIYCDNRITLSYPEIRNKISEGLIQLIKERMPETDAIAGVATAGIPQASIVADRLNLPMGYVRSKAKDHGLKNLIEGELRPGSKVTVIEDLISTGKSSLAAVDALQEHGYEVIGLLSNFNYGIPVAENTIKSYGIKSYTLSDYMTLIEVAIENKMINDSEIESLRAWRSRPNEWPG